MKLNSSALSSRPRAPAMCFAAAQWPSFDQWGGSLASLMTP